MTRHMERAEGDEALAKLGVLTEETASLIPGPVLSRQDFRDVQLEVFDNYPTDEAFIRTLLASVEMGANESLGAWSDHWSKPHIKNRRPSAPDFVLPTSVASEVLTFSRCRETELHAFDKGYAIKVFREALARRATGEVISSAEYQKPFRVSGDVYTVPGWVRKSLPGFASSAGFLSRLGNSQRKRQMAEHAFCALTRTMMDGARTAHPKSHDYFAYEGNRMPGPRPLYSQVRTLLDSRVAYKLLTETDNPCDIFLDDKYVNTDDAALCYTLAHRAITLSLSGFFRNGKVVVPRSEEDMDF